MEISKLICVRFCVSLLQEVPDFKSEWNTVNGQGNGNFYIQVLVLTMLSDTTDSLYLLDSLPAICRACYFKCKDYEKEETGPPHQYVKAILEILKSASMIS